jgi:hypothetical protein
VAAFFFAQASFRSNRPAFIGETTPQRELTSGVVKRAADYRRNRDTPYRAGDASTSMSPNTVTGPRSNGKGAISQPIGLIEGA